MDPGGEGDDGGDMSIRSVDLNFDDKRFAEEVRRLEALLVVRSTTAHENADLVVDKRLLYFLRARMIAFKVAAIFVTFRTVSLSEAPVEPSSFWTQASSFAKSRPKRTSQTY